MRRILPDATRAELGGLDPEAIQEVMSQAWPDIRDADELHDTLLSLVAIPDTDMQAWAPLAGELARARRATRAEAGGSTLWVAAERAEVFRLVYPSAVFERELPPVSIQAAGPTEARTSMIQGWMQHIGPTSVPELAARLGIAAGDVHEAMLRLEATGAVLRGSFRPPNLSNVDLRPSNLDEEWCDRRLLARIHALTLGRLRREIEPVPAATFMRWLLEWQHVAPGTQLRGERGTLEVLRQLQGFEAPANAWEPWLLGRRIRGYDPAVVDTLCLTGAVGWGRLSPHPATLVPHDVERGPRKRVVPTSVAPVTFFVREDADWLPAGAAGGPEELSGLSGQARAVLASITRAGASFFADLVRGTRLLKSEVEAALWELVAAGLVTADGFDSLRSLIDPRRRAGSGSGRSARPRNSTGRWSLLRTADAVDRQLQLEATCRMLLHRYGVVFRELVARESILPAWRDLLVTFRRFEDRGEVRGGRFSRRARWRTVRTAGGGGVAPRDAPGSALRPDHYPERGRSPESCGRDRPGDRVTAISGRFVRFRDGVALDVTDDAGSSLHDLKDAKAGA
jgi:ATP-dependent Lhr-like helicase